MEEKPDNQTVDLWLNQMVFALNVNIFLPNFRQFTWLFYNFTRRSRLPVQHCTFESLFRWQSWFCKFVQPFIILLNFKSCLMPFDPVFTPYSSGGNCTAIASFWKCFSTIGDLVTRRSDLQPRSQGLFPFANWGERKRENGNGPENEVVLTPSGHGWKCMWT